MPYIEEGKDAAVAYGSIDLKIKNNSDSAIELSFDASDENIIAYIWLTSLT